MKGRKMGWTHQQRDGSVYIDPRDRTDLGSVEEVVSELEATAPNDRAERLAHNAWQALTNLNAYIQERTRYDDSVGQHVWREADRS